MQPKATGPLDDGYGSFSGQDADDESDAPQTAAEPAKLREHLLGQINLMQMPDRDKRIVAFLIDTLDDDGYLTQDLDELAALLPAELEIEAEELTIALEAPAEPGAARRRRAQPGRMPGAAARSAARGHAVSQGSAANRDAASRSLAARDYFKLKKLLRCDDDALRGVQNLITSLNPRPAANFSDGETRYIVPDVIVRKIKGMWVAALNPDAMPKLRINRMYADILHRNRDASFQQLAGQLQEAKWLIKNVQQRFDTILRVSQAIVDRQRHFFEHGEVAMRPLVLREIAETLGLHESTVSRVTTQKFMLTPRGIFELKYFFGSHVTTETGGACSATAIRALIKQLVGEEDRANRCPTARSRKSSASRASWWRGAPSPNTGNLCRSCRSIFASRI